MSIAIARSQLRKVLAPLGFVELKPNTFWARTNEVLQFVQLGKVARVVDQLEIGLGFWSPFGSGAPTEAEAMASPLIRETIGNTARTPNSWKFAQFDADDVAQRIARIGAAFTRASDIAHHYSDRYHDEGKREALGEPLCTAHMDTFLAPLLCYSHATDAPSESQTQSLLRKLETELFAYGWAPLPSMDGHWVSATGTGGFHYCAYLNANTTGTLASICYYTASLADLQGTRSQSSLSIIHRSIKHTVKRGALAVHLPLLDLNPAAVLAARLLLQEEIDAFSANAIRPTLSNDGPG